MIAEPATKVLRHAIRVRAFAKINLSLRVLGSRPDGYHEVRTILQSLALHDTLTFHRAPGAFRISCDDPACPTDATNLVWQAAERVWAAAGRRGVPHGVEVRIAKRIPIEAGLGGGSSDAAATIRALAALWRIDLSDDGLRDIASSLGADVPYFLEGGTVLGVERGDVLFPLLDAGDAWVVLVVPGFGVSTADAYGWFDHAIGSPSSTRGARTQPAAARRPPVGTWPLGPLPSSEISNDLQGPVALRRPEIARLVAALKRRGAFLAAMSGSGSAVFGLFERQAEARAAVRCLGGRRGRLILTRTLGRSPYSRLARLAGRATHRINLTLAPRRSGHS